ncbi:MAG TPA: nucleoside-triphosphatase [Leptolinea sp.]
MDVEIFTLKRPITILTGTRGSGKTQTCQRWVDQARNAGWTAAGLLSPAVVEEGEKTGIDVINLATGERRRLADRVDRQSGYIVTDHWDFSPDALAWGNDVLGEILPCGLLVVDELGPLEFYRRQGWVKAFDTIQTGLYRLAVVVIRPELLDEARLLWPDSGIIDLDT